MTTEEAIQDIKISIQPSCGGKSLEMAIKALGKQIPKEFTLLNQDYGYFECSNCDHAINYGEDYTEHNYCLNCGQRLDWTEVVK